MNKNNKLTAILVITLAIIFGNLCTHTSKVDALEINTAPSTSVDNESCPKGRCPRGHMNLIKMSINELKEDGVLSEAEVKKIDSYMIKEREAKEAEIKEKIYNDECEKIDDMVKENVITKEKGEKIKSTIKSNLDEMQIYRKK